MRACVWMCVCICAHMHSHTCMCGHWYVCVHLYLAVKGIAGRMFLSSLYMHARICLRLSLISNSFVYQLDGNAWVCQLTAFVSTRAEK